MTHHRVWAQAPAAAPRRPSPAWGPLLAGVLLATPPAAIVIAAQSSDGVVVPVAMALALGAILGRLGPTRAVPAVGLATAAVVATNGRAVGGALALGALLLVALRRGAERDVVAVQSLGPIVGATVIATIVAPPAGRGAAVLLIQGAALACVLCVPSARRVLGSLGVKVHAAVERVGEAVASLVSIVMFGVLAALTVLVPWLVQRAFAVDPVRRIGRVPGWVGLQRHDAPANRPWSRDGSMGRVDRLHALRRAAASAMVVAAVLAGGVAVVRHVNEPSAESDLDVVPGALEGESWWPEYAAALRWMNTPGEDHVYVPFGPIRLKDFTSTYINVVDGERRTWASDACDDCERVTVWMYGGSTTFGIGQRDDHTIASELARLAAADGIMLDVVNRGMPAEMHWEEAQRFAWDAANEPPPDLTVFFDGINEMWSSTVLNDRGQGDDESRWNPETENARNQYEELIPSAEGFVDQPKPDDVTVTAPRAVTSERLDPSDLADHVIGRYEKSIDMSRATAGAHDIPTAWFWQPCPLSGRVVTGEPPVPNGQRSFAGDLCHAAVERLPDGVVDLSRGFDDRSTPIFIDSFHTNEVGARLAASLIYAELAPELRAMAGGSGP